MIARQTGGKKFDRKETVGEANLTVSRCVGIIFCRPVKLIKILHNLLRYAFLNTQFLPTVAAKNF